MQKNLLFELTKLKQNLEDSVGQRKSSVLECGLSQILQDIKHGATNIDGLNISEVDILSEFEDLECISKKELDTIEEIREWVFTKSINH